MFPQFCKTFCVFILIINILFCRKNQKNVLQEEIKNWTFEAYLLIEETSSWFQLIESLEMTRSCVFRGMCCPNSVKDCDLPEDSRRDQIGSVLTCAKLAKWTPTLNCLKSAKWPVRKSISPVMEKLETSDLESM